MAELTAAPAQTMVSRRTDHLLALVACWPLAGQGLALLVNLVAPSVPLLPVSAGAVVAYGVLAVAVALCLPRIARSLTPSIAAIVLVLLAAFMVTAGLDQTHFRYYVDIAAVTVSTCVTALLVATAITTRGLLLKYLLGSAVVLLLSGGLRMATPELLTDGGAVSYSQYAGYQLLPAAVIFWDRFVHRPRPATGVLFAAAALLLLGSGARGPAFVLLIYIVLRTLVVLFARPYLMLGLGATGVVAAAWLSSLASDTLNGLARAFAADGLSTRAVERLAAGNFLDDQVRSTLASHAWQIILEHPVTGIGIARDRILLAQSMGYTDPLAATGWYAHNIALEMLLQFGVLVGGALVVLTAVLILRAVVKATDQAVRRTLLIFIGIGLLPLLVSGSYLTAPLFFELIGFSLAAWKGYGASAGSTRRPDLGLHPPSAR